MKNPEPYKYPDVIKVRWITAYKTKIMRGEFDGEDMIEIYAKNDVKSVNSIMAIDLVNRKVLYYLNKRGRIDTTGYEIQLITKPVERFKEFKVVKTDE